MNKFIIDQSLNEYNYLVLDLFLLLRGVLSNEKLSLVFAVPLQLLRMGAHVLLITRSACVFLMNSAALGFSLTRPHWRSWPKKFSKGSWQMRLLRNTVTPGMVKIY